ncbi:MAG: hypothetical protein K9H16_09925 [Bacteroidales bacterium]|nr:hypothetical protein [Bacteroidales bacterium]
MAGCLWNFCQLVWDIGCSHFFNAGKMLGIAANGQEGSPFAEGIVTFSLISLSVAMLIICITLPIGLKRNMKRQFGM